MSKQKDRLSLSGMIPRNQREIELADFWYQKGWSERGISEMCSKNTRKVEIRAVKRIPRKRKAVA